MTGSALPHSAIVASHLSEFVKAVLDEVTDYSEEATHSTSFRGIFKTSLAAHSILEELRRGELPLLKSASGIARRLPMLLACRQLSLAYVELRRFIEVASWYPYFREHPVEWNEFSQHPEAGIVRDTADPIRYAAHRDIAWHHAYINSRFRDLPWVSRAVSKLSAGYATASMFVHAAIPAMNGSVSLPFDEMDEQLLRNFRETQSSILAAGCSVIVAAMPTSLSKLPAVERAWFDWLVGPQLSKTIRASAVGAGHRRRRRPSKRPK